MVELYYQTFQNIGKYNYKAKKKKKNGKYNYNFFYILNNTYIGIIYIYINLFFKTKYFIL